MNSYGTRLIEPSIDADLGGHVIKQRVARKGKGRRGGYRTLVLYRSGARAFFAYGFAKSGRDNIKDNELEALRKLAEQYLRFDNAQLTAAIAAGQVVEVMRNEQVQE